MSSTDALSAGQNLQNAQYVVNYDFPWKPVILNQRAGKIDRIGSDYDAILSCREGREVSKNAYLDTIGGGVIDSIN
jgi:superfamily II DNA/RNA helicase